MGLKRVSHIGSSEPIFEIRVEGQLSNEWSSWFEGLAIEQETSDQNGYIVTIISGPVADQPALHGILNKIRDLNLKLISVKHLPDQEGALRYEHENANRERRK